MSIDFPQKIIFKKIADNSEEIIVGPCHPGYGTTIGNALKRVMLSSLSGGAIFSIKIKGVQHEFSTIPNVLEDVVEIILNLKQIHFKVHSDKEVKLVLEAKGKKELKAKDIKPNSDVEVVTKDIHIATLTSSKAEIKIEMFVKNGIGYWPIEERGEKKDIGIIAIDAFFNPVKKVGMKIENTRVKQLTNYENIIFNIETCGVFSPIEALKQSVDILAEQFNFVRENLKSEKKEESKTAKKIEDKKEKEKDKDKKEKKVKDKKEDKVKK
ncbi:MAG: DNA-directed RNA polymerase subunit alpha [Patescibacteria group bacterium]|nr:DNA-directed RNA polymerase subunit alpha [Patescibacteria group bacterium]